MKLKIYYYILIFYCLIYYFILFYLKLNLNLMSNVDTEKCKFISFLLVIHI